MEKSGKLCLKGKLKMTKQMRQMCIVFKATNINLIFISLENAKL